MLFPGGIGLYRNRTSDSRFNRAICLGYIVGVFGVRGHALFSFNITRFSPLGSY